MTGLLADESMALAERAARRVLAACGEGDALETQISRFCVGWRGLCCGQCVCAQPRGGLAGASNWNAILSGAFFINFPRKLITGSVGERPVLMQQGPSEIATIRNMLADAEATLVEGPHAERARRDAETLMLHVMRDDAPDVNLAWLIAHEYESLLPRARPRAFRAGDRTTARVGEANPNSTLLAGGGVLRAEFQRQSRGVDSPARNRTPG